MSRLIRCLVVTSLLAGASLAPLRGQEQPHNQRRYFDPGLILETGGRTGTCDVMAFTADGKSLLAAGDDKVVRAWSFDKGQLAGSQALRWMIFRELRGTIYAMDLSPDRQNSRVVIAGLGIVDMTLTVLDRKTGEVIHSWYPRKEDAAAFERVGGRVDYPVRALAHSPSGKRIAVGSDNGGVWIWDPAEVKVRARAGKSFTQPLPSLKWNADGVVRYLGRHQAKDQREFNRIRLLRWLDDDTLLSLSSDGQLRRWKLGGKGKPKSELLFTFRRSEDKEDTQTFVRCAVVSPDGRWIVAGHTELKEPAIELLDLGKLLKGEDVSSVRRLMGETDVDVLESLAFSADSKRLAVGVSAKPRSRPLNVASSGKVILVSMDDVTKMTAGPKLSRVPEALAFHPDGKYLAVAGGDDHEVTVWDVSDKEPRFADQAVGVGRSLWAIALSADSKQVGFKNRRDHEADNPNRMGKGPWQVFDLTTCRWADDASKFVPLEPVESMDGWKVQPRAGMKWQVIDPKGARFPLPLDAGRDLYPMCYTFLRNENDEPQLAVGHYYGVSLFALKTGQAPVRWRLFNGHASEVTALCASKDGKLLVTASTDQTVAAWRLSTWPTESELGASFLTKPDSKKIRRLYVEDVDPGSPAWEMGLKKGEEILTCFFGVDEAVYDSRGHYLGEMRRPPNEKTPVPRLDPDECATRLKKARPNVECYFEVVRDGKVSALSTTVRQRPLWQLFPTKQREWVVWRWRDYYYHCSTRGDDFVGWQLSHRIDRRPDFWPAEKFRQRFHQPEKVMRMLEDSTTAPEDVAVPNLQPPQVWIESVSPANPKPGEDVTVKVGVKRRGDSFLAQPSRVTLWVNDCLVDDLKLSLRDSDEEVFTTIKLPYAKLREGDNPLIAQAFNEAGIRDDYAETSAGRYRAIVHRAEKAKDRRLRGLMVGVSKYPGRLELQFAASDARAMRDAWGKRTAGEVYTSVTKPRLLLDRDATAEKILEALKELQAEVAERPDDLVVIFLAGHGDAAEAHTPWWWWREWPSLQPPSWKFLAGDYVEGVDKTLLHGTDLQRALSAMPCRKLVLLDTCRSGANADAVRQLMPENVGPIVFASCRAEESAHEAAKYKAGLFTHLLLQVMGDDFQAEAKAKKKPALSAADLKEYVSGKMSKLLDEVAEERARELKKAKVEKLKQTPYLIVGRGGDEKLLVVTPP